MRVNWKKILLVGSDVVLGTYIVVAMTAFNKPDGEDITCKQVDINIQDVKRAACAPDAGACRSGAAAQSAAGL